jgi:hypothetical protein
MRALSIRQPFAEMILRGIKTVEYRSRPTKIVGERFWIYASKNKAQVMGLGQVVEVERNAKRVVADNIAVPTDPPPKWMLDLAAALRLWDPRIELPTGMIVGSAIIEKVLPAEGLLPPSLSNSALGPTTMYEWHLTGVERIDQPRKPSFHPQPVWFRPF